MWQWHFLYQGQDPSNNIQSDPVQKQIIYVSTDKCIPESASPAMLPYLGEKNLSLIKF